MITDVTADTAAFREVLRCVDPGLQLVSVRDLLGGVSARVTALKAVTSAGLAANLVIRQYGAHGRERDPQIAAHEYHLLRLLHLAGLRVPRPLLADEPGAIVPGPCLVIEYVDGDAMIDPARAPLAESAVISQLARELARCGPNHAAALGSLRGTQALRHAGRMGTWGLPPAELDRLQSGHREFVRMITGRH